MPIETSWNYSLACLVYTITTPRPASIHVIGLREQNKLYGKSWVNYRWRIAKWLIQNPFMSMQKHGVKMSPLALQTQRSAGRYLKCQFRWKAQMWINTPVGTKNERRFGFTWRNMKTGLSMYVCMKWQHILLTFYTWNERHSWTAECWNISHPKKKYARFDQKYTLVFSQVPVIFVW
jgi:hypothetical protein